MLGVFVVFAALIFLVIAIGLIFLRFFDVFLVFSIVAFMVLVVFAVMPVVMRRQRERSMKGVLDRDLVYDKRLFDMDNIFLESPQVYSRIAFSYANPTEIKKLLGERFNLNALLTDFSAICSVVQKAKEAIKEAGIYNRDISDELMYGLLKRGSFIADEYDFEQEYFEVTGEEEKEFRDLEGKCVENTEIAEKIKSSYVSFLMRNKIVKIFYWMVLVELGLSAEDYPISWFYWTPHEKLSAIFKKRRPKQEKYKQAYVILYFSQRFDREIKLEDIEECYRFYKGLGEISLREVKDLFRSYTRKANKVYKKREEILVRGSVYLPLFVLKNFPTVTNIRRTLERGGRNRLRLVMNREDLRVLLRTDKELNESAVQRWFLPVFMSCFIFALSFQEFENLMKALFVVRFYLSGNGKTRDEFMNSNVLFREFFLNRDSFQWQDTRFRNAVAPLVYFEMFQGEYVLVGDLEGMLPVERKNLEKVVVPRSFVAEDRSSVKECIRFVLEFLVSKIKGISPDLLSERYILNRDKFTEEISRIL